MPASRALIFTNGSLPDLDAARRLVHPLDVLLAADGGSRHLLSLGLAPCVVIGDLDSLLDEERKRLESAGTVFVAHPRDKNETDLELALKYALQQGYDPILVVAALGGRIDQELANLSLLTDASLAGRDIRLEDGRQQAFFIRTSGELQGAPGDLVSLVAWGGEVTGIRTRGLKWSLQGESLYPHKTRGISNEMLEPAASIEIGSGLLLVIHHRHPG